MGCFVSLACNGVLAFLFALCTPLLLWGNPSGKTDFSIAGAKGIAIDGRRQLAAYEEDSFGPLPFPELVQKFINDEVELLLKRQNTNGSFKMTGGRTTEAGGTVDSITLASLCGYSIRHHTEVNPASVEKAISKALDFVIYMVRSGKLRNGRDAAWRYAYSLRFLVNEYPYLEDQKTRALVEDACLFLIHGLRDLQQGTRGQKSIPVNWLSNTSLGIDVEDDPNSGLTLVIDCPEDTPAYLGGIRKGDLLRTAGGIDIHTTLRFYLEEMKWEAGDTIQFEVSRNGKPVSYEVLLPSQYPGTIGFTCRDGERGAVLVDQFGPLGDFTGGVIDPGDRIVEIDGKLPSDSKAFGKLQWFAGQRVKIELESNGKSKSVEIECRPVNSASLGIALKGGIDHSTIDGFAIQKMSGSSCLRKAGVKVGDRIVKIDGRRVLNRRHFSEIENALWGGQTIEVTCLNADGREVNKVRVVTGNRSDGEWLQGYHGITISNKRVEGASVLKVDPGSPAEIAGCSAGDVITEINGQSVTSPRAGLRTLSAFHAGQEVNLTLSTDSKQVEATFDIHRATDSPWISSSTERSGGWAYYTHIRGGTTFLTSDILRELIYARKNLPFDVPEELIQRPFNLLSKVRWKQPNSEVESYRYDWGGSFGGVRDIRGDVGRICAVELACLMYNDSDLPVDKEFIRTQDDLEKSLREWLQHRGILEYAKTGGHQKFSVAPWYLPYSFMVTLQAAEYLTSDDKLQEEVRRNALKTYFKYARIDHIDDLGGEGWQIGGYPKKQLLRSCLLLDGLATMKHLYQPELKITDGSLQKARAEFGASNYGKAYVLAVEAKKTGKVLELEVESLLEAIHERFNSRLDEIKSIHEIYYRDAVDYIKEMKPHFAGLPMWSEAETLMVEWEKAFPDKGNH